MNSPETSCEGPCATEDDLEEYLAYETMQKDRQSKRSKKFERPKRDGSRVDGIQKFSQRQSKNQDLQRVSQSEVFRSGSSGIKKIVTSKYKEDNEPKSSPARYTPQEEIAYDVDKYHFLPMPPLHLDSFSNFDPRGRPLIPSGHISTLKFPTLEKTKQTWRKADAVMFDFDSTLVKELSILELTKFCGRTSKILELANQALKNAISYRHVLDSFVNTIKPTWQQIRQFNALRGLTLSPNAKELIYLLHRRKVEVYVTCAGFLSLVAPITKELFIKEENVFANSLKFYYSGEFAGYKEDEPMAVDTGKSLIAENLKRRFSYRHLVNIGDGYTDLKACPPTDAFIGYGGNVVRELVKSRSGWYVHDFEELIEELQK